MEGVKHVLIPGSKKTWIVNFNTPGAPRVTGKHRVLGVPVYSHPSPTQRRLAIEIASRQV